MLSDNSTQNIFRFMQLRAATVNDEGEPLSLSGQTALANQLAVADQNGKTKIAKTFLRKSNSIELIGSALAQHILEIVKELHERNGSVEDLRNEIGRNSKELRGIRENASDVLLASKFANWSPPHHPEVEMLFRASNIVLDRGVSSSAKLGKYKARPIALPEALTRRAIDRNELAKKLPLKRVPVSSTAEDTSPEQIHHAMEELISLARPETLLLPTAEDDSNVERMFSLNERGMKRLSSDTRVVLSKLGLQPDTHAVDRVIQALQAEVALAAQRLARQVSIPRIANDQDEELPYIKDVGVADLLVVKQHLKAYERVDIAHVENVLIGEKKSRTHRALERTEETFTTEREITQEKKTELETAERFELNKETAQTMKQDQQFGFGLTLSGKYGPTVEFSSNLTASSTSSTEESTKNAIRYSKDIVERSLERVVERVRTEQIRRVIREQEETNLHELVNPSPTKHISGVYQFLEKVYESQVFNYGLRQMFDFMVPEPASYIWHIEKTETNLKLPPPPMSLDSVAPTADSINDLNYLYLAAKLGAEGIEMPPPPFVTVSTSIISGAEASGDDSEGGQPRSVIQKEITVPAGYKSYRAMIGPLALTDDELTVAVTIGNSRRVWKPGTNELVNVGSDHRIGTAQLGLFLLGNTFPYDSQSKLAIHVLAFETKSYSVSVEVIFSRMIEAYRAWQIKTYDKLSRAYQANLQRYEAKVAELKAEARAEQGRANPRFGAPPTQNVRIVKEELKKHCVSIVTRQRYEDFSPVQDGDPPFFGFPEAAEQGAFTRFFEQAFEWDQMQYVFYPYFWSRQDTWASRFTRDEVDTQFLEFLQAGAARVVVPVRPGFEVALLHYLETKQIWNGVGEPPTITDPLYVPIVTEIQERTQSPQGEIAVGEPWTTRVPTPLVILRSEENLPHWERLDPTQWDWQEAED